MRWNPIHTVSLKCDLFPFPLFAALHMAFYFAWAEAIYQALFGIAFLFWLLAGSCALFRCLRDRPGSSMINSKCISCTCNLAILN